MKFEYPIWLVVMAVVLPLIGFAFRRFGRSRVAALKTFAAEHLLKALTANVSVALRMAKRWLFAIAVALCLIALARPQAGFRWQEVKRKGIDIVFAVDTSKSMLAQDVSPNRLTRAKLAVLDLVEKLQGDRVGLIAFAGRSFLQSPLTLDYDAFNQSLDALDTTIIPKGGTDIASAIHEAENAFSLGAQSHKILVILTDGEDLEANGVEAAREAAKNGMKIFTVGVGSTAGEMIPIQNEQGGVEFLKDDKGQPVIYRLDDSTLRQIAEVTGGAYQPLGQQGQGLDAIYKHGLAELPKQDIASRMNKIYIERFQWPLALAVLLLVIEMMLGERKLKGYGVRGKGYRFGFARKEAVAAALLMMLATSAWASPQSAEKAYRAEKYPEAAAQYKEAVARDPKKTELQYNLGDATYKSQAYADAAAVFQKALKTDKVDLQQQTFYNLGNTQYRIGQQTEKNNPQQTIETWKQALASYESAMQLKKDDADAKYNYEFVKKKLEELQKQQQQKKDQNKDQDKDKDKDQKKDQKDQGQDKNKDQNKDQQDKDQKKDEKNDDHNKDQQGQNKDEQKQDQQKKDQQNKDQQKPNQDQNKDQKQDPKENPGQQPKPQDQQDQAKQQAGDQQKKDQKKDGQQAGAKPEDKKGGKPEEKEVQLLPGQMSKEEAKNLLDSLKGDEKKMPVSIGKGQAGQWEDAPQRDW